MATGTSFELTVNAPDPDTAIKMARLLFAALEIKVKA